MWSPDFRLWDSRAQSTVIGMPRCKCEEQDGSIIFVILEFSGFIFEDIFRFEGLDLKNSS